MPTSGLPYTAWAVALASSYAVLAFAVQAEVSTVASIFSLSAALAVVMSASVSAESSVMNSEISGMASPHAILTLSSCLPSGTLNSLIACSSVPNVTSEVERAAVRAVTPEVVPVAASYTVPVTVAPLAAPDCTMRNDLMSLGSSIL